LTIEPFSSLLALATISGHGRAYGVDGNRLSNRSTSSIWLMEDFPALANFG
jgi:hypothetical protein